MEDAYMGGSDPISDQLDEYDEDSGIKEQVFFTNKRAQPPESMIKHLAPEKRARFERTQEILAKSGLLDITKKTAILIKSNQQAQADLLQLRQEITDFVQAVLANPENKGKSLLARDTFAADPLCMERGQQQQQQQQQQSTSTTAKPTQVSVIKSHQSSPYQAKYHHQPSPAPPPAEPSPSPYHQPTYTTGHSLVNFQGFLAEGGGGSSSYADEELVAADTTGTSGAQYGPAPPHLQLYQHQPSGSYSDSA